MIAAPRLLSPTELGALGLVHARCFPDEAWTPRDFMDLLKIRGASGHVLAPEEDFGIQAFIVDVVVADDAEILTIGVVPESRRAGLARALIDDLARRARRKHASRIVLEVASDNFAAIRLYESSGFTLLGERPAYYRRPGGKVDAYILGLPL